MKDECCSNCNYYATDESHCNDIKCSCNRFNNAEVIADLGRMEGDAFNLIERIRNAIKELQAGGNKLKYELVEVDKYITKINEILARVEKNFNAS